MTPLSRIGVLVAGILGAAGVAAAAGASHGGDTALLGSLALIALTQAPAILALSLHGGINWFMRAGGIVVAAGAVLFCADLALRHFTGNHLFPMSAPIGGTGMIAGWLLLAVSALLPRRT